VQRRRDGLRVRWDRNGIIGHISPLEVIPETHERRTT
jgi:hypothetical protein